MRLNLGCNHTRIPGFKGVDMVKYPETDIVCDISDLKFAKDNTIETIYASHCLEHFSHKKTLNVLKEWYRVLKPKGKLCVAVPNIQVIAKIVLEYGCLEWVQHVLYGDQANSNEFHYNCFDYSMLLSLLNEAGFKKIERVGVFDIGEKIDCSRGLFLVKGNGVSTSLNMIAQK